MVMKKLYLRMMREIKSNMGQFISIVLVIAVGSMLLAGMFAATTGMHDLTDQYYKDQNLADAWSYFKGISEEEVQDLSNTDGITAAEGRYTYNADIVVDGSESTLRIHSLTNINRPLLTEGSLPENTNEIIIDYKYARANKLSVGEHITIKSVDFVIYGFCMNPEYAYKQKDAATAVVSDKAFGIAYAQKETLLTLNKNSDIYLELEEEINDKLNEAKSQIDDAKAKLKHATASYNEKKAAAEEGFSDAVKKLAATKKDLDSAQIELTNQKNEFNQTIQDAQSQIDDAREQLNNAKEQLDLSYAQYLTIRPALSAEEQQIQDAAFEMQYTQLEENIKLLNDQQNALDAQKDETQHQFAVSQTQIDYGYSQYQKAVTKLTKTKEQTYAQFSDIASELEDNQNKISDAEAEYALNKTKAEDELKQALENYQEVLLKASDLSLAEAAVNSNDNYISFINYESQASYAMVSSSLDPIKTVSYIFPLIFFLVAAIIAFISMSKNVENQRTQIAVMQALGISKWKIRLSFLSYSLTASVFGSILFALLGNIFIPKSLIKPFVSRFEMPAISIPIYPLYILLPLLLAIIFCSIATFMAVEKVLKEIPAQAMRPRPPKNSKTILLERFTSFWKELNYSGKLISRNIFLNKGRMFLSAIGIIGSFMLILTGFSLKYSASNAIDTAINSINYDISAVYTDPVGNKSSLDFDFPLEDIELTHSMGATLKTADDIDINMQIIETNSALIDLYDSDKNRIDIQQDSFILPSGLANQYGLSKGSVVMLTIADVDYQFTVTDVSTQYVTEKLYISYDLAKKAGLDIEMNSAIIKLKNADDLNTATAELLEDDAIKSVNTKQDIVSRSEDMLRTLNITIYIIILSAAVLAITVIYNISSINIFERTREYATLMVLGYFKKEIYRLMFVENMILTSLGCLLGLPLGVMLYRYLIEVISRSNLTLPNQINGVIVLLALLLTFVFSIATNIIIRPKIKKIVLVEALKSVE